MSPDEMPTPPHRVPRRPAARASVVRSALAAAALVVGWRAAGARSRAERDEALSEQLASERWLARLHAAVSDVATLSADTDRDPDALFALVCERAAELLGADAAAVVRFDGLRGFIVGQAGSGLIPSEQRLDEAGSASLVAQTGTTARIDDYAAATGAFAARMAQAGLRSAVAAPVRVRGVLWGCIVVVSAESGGVSQLDPEGVGDGEDASRRIVERRSGVVLPAVVGDWPCGDDVPLSGPRALAELDGERGEDNDLSAVVDRLDRVRAWAVEHCPCKHRIVGLRRPRGGDEGAVPDPAGVDPQAVVARRPADEARREAVVREADVPPRRDLGLLDRRRRWGVRLHGGGHGRGDDVVAVEQRNRAVVFAAPQ